MNIIFVNNQTDADTILSQQLIDDIVGYFDTPDGVAFNFVDMSISRQLGYKNTYKVYNYNWVGQDIQNISYCCDDANLNTRVMDEILNP